MERAPLAAEAVARASYGRLVALLAGRTHDIAAAEDALGDAFRAALQRWPQTGVPERPEAWLLTAARRVLGHAHRHGGVRAAAEHTIETLCEEAAMRSAEASFPDERLKLMFVCAHPAIDAGARTPLMLQTVLGLDAARIAAAFLVAPAAMSQRLVRAKTKIRDARLRFATPQPEELPERLSAVLSAVYAAFTGGWELGASDVSMDALAPEAIYLGRLLVQLLPEEPEAAGLLALMLYCDARKEARRSADGAFVPLVAQDRTRWSRDLVVEAEATLAAAAAHGRPGRFQIEAAIQSAHVTAPPGGADPRVLAALYDLLVAHAPSAGALIARAVAHGDASGAATGLAMLDQLEAKLVEEHQPFWAARAHLLARGGERDAARVAYDRAIALSPDAAVRRYLARQQAALATR